VCAEGAQGVVAGVCRVMSAREMGWPLKLEDVAIEPLATLPPLLLASPGAGAGADPHDGSEAALAQVR
jgi:hypothetical protein